eukprot:PhF_6_TR28111/c1_g1_i2/m.41563
MFSMSRKRLCDQLYQKALQHTATMVRPLPVTPLPGITLFPNFITALEETWILETFSKEVSQQPLCEANKFQVDHDDDVFTEDMWKCIEVVTGRVNAATLTPPTTTADKRLFTASFKGYGAGGSDDFVVKYRTHNVHMLVLQADASLVLMPEGIGLADEKVKEILIGSRGLCSVSEDIFRNYRLLWKKTNGDNKGSGKFSFVTMNLFALPSGKGGSGGHQVNAFFDPE